jgi:predicted RNase H-like HicB family nuclease
MAYVVIIEREGNTFGAYVPDLPGCVAVGETEDEVRLLIREAIELHIEAIRKAGEAIPQPTTTADLVEVSG